MSTSSKSPDQQKIFNASYKKHTPTPVLKGNCLSIVPFGTFPNYSSLTTMTSNNKEVSWKPLSNIRSGWKPASRPTPILREISRKKYSEPSLRSNSLEPLQSSSVRPQDHRRKPRFSDSPLLCPQSPDQLLQRQEHYLLYQWRLALKGYLLPVGQTKELGCPPNLGSRPTLPVLCVSDTGTTPGNTRTATRSQVFGILNTALPPITKDTNATDAHSKATLNGTAPPTCVPIATPPPQDIDLRNVPTTQVLLATLVILKLVMLKFLLSPSLS